jgi:hypothetical protein
MNRSAVSIVCAVAFCLGLVGLTGCGGSSSSGPTVLVPSISSFTANPASIVAGSSSALTADFVNGSATITPGNLAVTSGVPVNVSPTATTTYTVTVTPASGSAVTQTVTVTVTAPVGPSITSFGATPATIAAGTSSSLTGVFAGGTGVITPGNLAATSGTAVSVSPAVTTTYTLTVTPASGTAVTQTATVTVDPLPTIASFTSAPATIAAGGSASLTAVFANGTGVIAPGNLAVTSGTAVNVSPTTSTVYTLTVTPPVGTAITQTATVSVQSAVTVDLSSSGPAVTDQLMGMNMAAWFDPTNPAVVPAFKTAGIKAVRWPGGSWSDDYHWANNTLCGGYPNSNATWSQFLSSVVVPADVDVALTADYGTNAACNGPGDPTEAAAWAANALANGNHVSHMTVGNENYGNWETDMHTKQWDAATYANAAATGYYPDIKAANPNLLVGVSVNPGNSPAWDPTVLAGAKYDFVEYHYYPQSPFGESDTYLVQKAAQDLTKNINTIKTELATAGKPNTPIYVGELGSVYTTPGKQSMSITQALYAGQVLGELMNAGVSRATWWIGFGGCDSDPTVENFSSSLYGWQNYGGYMVFSDGLPEGGCNGSNIPTVPAGTLLPTARAFQLFSNVAIDGETVLTADVTGDNTAVVAYAATNPGGTALVLFNRNETTSAPVTVTLNGQTTSTSVTVMTYSKAIYDLSQNNVWAPPTTVNLGAQTLPLTLNLDPWSMNVVIVK